MTFDIVALGDPALRLTLALVLGSAGLPDDAACDTEEISMCRPLRRFGSQSARVLDRKSACFWLSPSSATRSPGRMSGVSERQ